MLALPMALAAGVMFTMMDDTMASDAGRPAAGCGTARTAATPDAYRSQPPDRALGLVLRPGDRMDAVTAALGPPTLSRDLAGGGRSLEYVFPQPRVAARTVPDLPSPDGRAAEPTERRIANLVIVADAAGLVRLLQENPNPFTFGGPRLLRGSADRIIEATLLAGPGQWVPEPERTDRAGNPDCAEHRP
jgi:hypothetical protein